MLLLRWVINALTLLIVAWLLPGFQIGSFWIALLAALVLGLVNALIKPLLVLLTLPITILTLGLFLLVINGFMLWIVASVVPGFQIANFSTAVTAAVILWLISWVASSLLTAKP